MANAISKINNPALLSRFESLALETSMTIDKTFTAGVILPKGTLMGKQVSGGKYRPYFEGTVITTAFTTGTATFALDPTVQVGPVAIQVGDVIENATSGAALGTVLTYNASTGVGTLAANSSNALGVGGKVRIATSQLAIAAAAGKVLKDETVVDASLGIDGTAVGYYAGHFIQANTTISALALTAMSGQTIDSGECRLV